MEFSILGFSFARGRGGGGEYPHPPNQVNRIKIFLFVALSTERFEIPYKQGLVRRKLRLFVLELQSSMQEVKGS